MKTKNSRDFSNSFLILEKIALRISQILAQEAR